MTEHVVAAAEELGESERVILQPRIRGIGVVKFGGEYRSYMKWYAHQSGPLWEDITTECGRPRR